MKFYVWLCVSVLGALLNPYIAKAEYMYEVVDEAYIAAPPRMVHTAIIEGYDGLNSWGMPYLSSRNVNGRSCGRVGGECEVTLYEIIPMKFVARTESIHLGRSMHVSYIDGIFSGNGYWTFTPVDGGTHARFVWKTDPSGILMDIASLVYPVERKHSMVMQWGFKNIKAQLEE